MRRAFGGGLAVAALVGGMVGPGCAGEDTEAWPRAIVKLDVDVPAEMGVRSRADKKCWLDDVDAIEIEPQTLSGDSALSEAEAPRFALSGSGGDLVGRRCRFRTEMTVENVEPIVIYATFGGSPVGSIRTMPIVVDAAEYDSGTFRSNGSPWTLEVQRPK